VGATSAAEMSARTQAMRKHLGAMRKVWGVEILGFFNSHFSLSP